MDLVLLEPANCRLLSSKSDIKAPREHLSTEKGRLLLGLSFSSFDSDQVFVDQSFRMHNHKLAHDQSPVERLPDPLGCYVLHGQIQNLEKGIISRENRPVLRDLPELSVETLDGFGGIDQFPELHGISEEGCELVPVVLPALHTCGISLAPGGLEFKLRAVI